MLEITLSSQGRDKQQRAIVLLPPSPQDKDTMMSAYDSEVCDIYSSNARVTLRSSLGWCWTEGSGTHSSITHLQTALFIP